ncbi:hypothetical protein [Agromyces sp. Marseille-P2726]|uniref:hypothetical protein n=1 Tax=Agromyces sp. Marseille-P2726 TaxID=2709132 RepID=UPI00156FCD41|nr:hypothetical protein [Agromyces sp. Marseille-P2726]
MARLRSVLDTDDLPIAELCAARLDGEVVAIDHGWVPVDEPDHAASRAALVALQVPRSLIIERLSAAWVHGAIASPPVVAQFCVPYSARIAVLNHRRVSVREVRIDARDIVEVGDQPCTTIDRTAFDVLRDHTLDDRVACDVVAALHHVRPEIINLVEHRLDGAVRMPHRSLAVSRLRRTEAALRSAGRAGASRLGDHPPSLTR